MERFRKIGTHPDAHRNGIWGLAEIPEGQREVLGDFLTGGADGLLKLWRLRREEIEQVEADEEKENTKDPGIVSEVRTFKDHALHVVHVAVSRDMPVAASTSLDGVVKIWDLGNESNEPKSLQMGVTESWDIAISADGQKIVTGGTGGVVQIIDTNLKAVEETFSIGVSRANGKDSSRKDLPMVMAVALSEDDTKMALGAHDGTVSVLDVETGKPVCDKLAKHGGPVRSIAFLPNEPSTIMTGSDDQLINLYDTESGHVTGNCRGHAGMVYSVRGSRSGKYLTSGGSDWTVRVWDRVMRESIYSSKSHNDSVWGVSFAAGDSRIVSVSDDGSIGLLDSSMSDSVS